MTGGSRPLRVGVVGSGDVAQHTYLPRLAEAQRKGRLQLTALADRVRDRAETLAARHGIPHVFTSHTELAASEVDIVVNLTPVQVHAAVTLDCVRAGRNVYSEKPLATTLTDADQIIAEAARVGVTVASAPALLTHPDIQQALRWIRTGTIGKICFVRARASHPGPDRLADFLTDPTWFYQDGGGPLVDLGVYPLHVITGMLGSARRVSAFSGRALTPRVARYGEASGKRIDLDVDDNTHLMLDFDEGRYAVLDATYCVLSTKGPRMEIYGETGAMNLAGEPDEPPIEIFRADLEHELRGWMTPEKIYRGRVGPPRRGPAAPEYSLVTGIEHLVDHLGTGTPLLLTAEHARHVLEIMLAARESASLGAAVRLTTTFDPPTLHDLGDTAGRPMAASR